MAANVTDMNAKDSNETGTNSATGQTIGYARVSSAGQNLSRQFQQLEDFGCEKVFQEKLTGGNKERPQLQAALDYAREGDVFVCTSMDRLARSLPDLYSIATELTNKGVGVHFLKEVQTYSRESTAIAKLMLGLLGSIAEFERALIRERQAEGIARAKERGIYQGRKPTLGEEQIISLRELVQAGVSKSEVARRFGISRTSVYRYLGITNKNKE